MGAAGSSSPYRATVYRDGDDKAFSVVRVSDEVIRRFRERDVARDGGSQEAYEVDSSKSDDRSIVHERKAAVSSEPTKIEQLLPVANVDSRQFKREQDVHHQLDDLLDGTERKLKEASAGLQKTVFAHTSPAVCEAPEKELLKCYSENPKRSLRCREVAEKFLECMGQYTITDRNLS